MTIQVTDSFNQLKIVSGNIVQYYKYATVKSLSPVSDSKGDFAVIINFIVDDKNNPLILKMKDVSNQGTWVNNATGANAATISDWMHTDNPSTEVQVTGWTSPLGQKPMATSIPVVISSDQSDIDVILKGPLGQAAEAASVSVVIASDQTGAIRTPGIERVTNAANVAAGAYSVSFANVHASANSTVKTVILKPGETITFDAGAVNNTLGAIAYVATGSELLIIKIT